MSEQRRSPDAYGISEEQSRLEANVGTRELPHIDPAVMAGVAARIADEETFARWRTLVAQAHFCVNPVRISGRIYNIDPETGHRRVAYNTAAEPDGVLLKACGTRREAICPACAEFYRNDAFFLVSAGLAGGKGIPESVSSHPACFFTTTAPSFGAVHRQSQNGSLCHPAGAGEVCKHKVDKSCWAIHEADDPKIGSAICGSCYEYRAQVLFNALSPELFRRTMVYATRAIAKVTGLPVADVKRSVRLSHVKVAEFQARGTVHFHAVVRLDSPEGDELLPPPEPFDACLLARALIMAARSVWVAYPKVPGVKRIRARWGEQVHVAIIASSICERPTNCEGQDEGDSRPREQSVDGKVPGAVASYLAKYSCKSLVTTGNLNHRVDHANLDRLGLRAHERRLVEAALALASRRECQHLKLHLHAHVLGHKGQFLTKGRNYSTTFAALRSERRAYRLAHAPDREIPIAADDRCRRFSELAFVGRGYSTPGDGWLAQSLQESRQEARRQLREASVELRRAEPEPVSVVGNEAESR